MHFRAYDVITSWPDMTWPNFFLQKMRKTLLFSFHEEYLYLRWLVSSHSADLWPSEAQNCVFPIDLRVKRTLAQKPLAHFFVASQTQTKFISCWDRSYRIQKNSALSKTKYHPCIAHSYLHGFSRNYRFVEKPGTYIHGFSTNDRFVEQSCIWKVSYIRSPLRFLSHYLWRIRRRFCPQLAPSLSAALLTGRHFGKLCPVIPQTWSLWNNWVYFGAQLQCN